MTLFLKEAGLDYEMVPIDTRRGEQFTPALTDDDITIFDSSAIQAASVPAKCRPCRPVALTDPCSLRCAVTMQSDAKPTGAKTTTKGRAGNMESLIYDQVRTDILSGKLAPGTPLSQLARAEAGGTSRGPVR